EHLELRWRIVIAETISRLRPDGKIRKVYAGRQLIASGADLEVRPHAILNERRVDEHRGARGGRRARQRGTRRAVALERDRRRDTESAADLGGIAIHEARPEPRSRRVPGTHLLLLEYRANVLRDTPAQRENAREVIGRRHVLSATQALGAI